MKLSSNEKNYLLFLIEKDLEEFNFLFFKLPNDNILKDKEIKELINKIRKGEKK